MRGIMQEYDYPGYFSCVSLANEVQLIGRAGACSRILVCQAQTREYMAFVGFEEIPEAGTFDRRPGVQAATAQAVVLPVKPGL